MMEITRNEYLKGLEEDLTLLISDKDLAFVPSERENILEFINAGEYGLAFETICFFIKEKKICVSEKTKAIILNLARVMKIDSKYLIGIV